MSKISNKNIRQFGEISNQDAEDLKGESLRQSMEFNAFGEDTIFDVLVLTNPVSIVAGDPRVPANNEQPFFEFKGRIQDRQGVKSPHSTIPDPENPWKCVNKEQLIDAHTTFVTSPAFQMQGDRPKKGDICKVSLTPGQFSYNLQQAVIDSIIISKPSVVTTKAEEAIDKASQIMNIKEKDLEPAAPPPSVELEEIDLREEPPQAALLEAELEQATVEQLIASHPPGDGLPCCSYVSVWSINQAKIGPPANPAKLVKEHSWQRLVDINQWGVMQLAGGGVNSFDNLPMYANVIGIAPQNYEESTFLSVSLPPAGASEDAYGNIIQMFESLSPGRWSICQFWRLERSNIKSKKTGNWVDYSNTGHTILIYRFFEDSNKIRIKQSGKTRGFRDEEWDFTKNTRKMFLSLLSNKINFYFITLPITSPEEQQIVPSEDHMRVAQR